MKLAAWHHPSRILMLSAATLLVGVMACSDTTTPKQISKAGVPGPQFTVGAGITSTTVGRGNFGTFHIQSKEDGYQIELKAKDNTDMVIANLSAVPGGTSGWHSHPGVLLSIIKTGALTYYDANDPTCTPTVRSAGMTFMEEAGNVHFARNEGTETATWVSVYIVPAGSGTRVDGASPGNCAF